MQRFVGEMARETAVERLEPHKSGVYLIRERRDKMKAEATGDYTLSIKYVITRLPWLLYAQKYLRPVNVSCKS